MGLNSDPGLCDRFSSAGSSKIKIQTSSWHKAQVALCHDDVRTFKIEKNSDRCVTHNVRSSLPPNCTVLLFFIVCIWNNKKQRSIQKKTGVDILGVIITTFRTHVPVA